MHDVPAPRPRRGRPKNDRTQSGIPFPRAAAHAFRVSDIPRAAAHAFRVPDIPRGSARGSRVSPKIDAGVLQSRSMAINRRPMVTKPGWQVGQGRK